MSEYSLLLGERSAEDIKVGAGSAFPLREELSIRVAGRDLATGLPHTVTITSPEVRRAIETPVLQIVELVRATGCVPARALRRHPRPRHRADRWRGIAARAGRTHAP